MARTLVVVESGKKAGLVKWLLNTAGLGGDVEYDVIASSGHVCDLPVATLGVDLASFDVEIVHTRPAKIKLLRAAAAKADNVILMTDPDREGEAIAFHLQHALARKGLVFTRATTNEITARGLRAALAAPRDIDMQLVQAQLARRALDRIIGYKLGASLSKGLPRRGRERVTCGRVQCAAMVLLDRHAAPREPVYRLHLDGMPVHLCDATSLGRADPPRGASSNRQDECPPVDRAEALRVLRAVQGDRTFKRTSVRTDTVEELPPRPYKTSTLQQDAFYKLGFVPSKTMEVAQRLYERGLITYMRTESEWMSSTGISRVKDRVPSSEFAARPGLHRGAHECIRPSFAAGLPRMLSRDPPAGKKAPSALVKLYDLITSRTVASQMRAAIVKRTTDTFASGSGVRFSSTSCRVTEPHYLDTYDDRRKFSKACSERRIDATVFVPSTVEMVEAAERPGYTEAGLIREMERAGIGRPSTFAGTVVRLVGKGYVVNAPVSRTVDVLTLSKNGNVRSTKRTADMSRALVMTDRGRQVLAFIGKHYGPIASTEFTSDMEAALDSIAEGTTPYLTVMRRFWTAFKDFHETVMSDLKNAATVARPAKPSAGRRFKSGASPSF
jgi:DNA topoisomerase-1